VFGPALTFMRISGIPIGLHWSLVVMAGGVGFAIWRGMAPAPLLIGVVVVLLSVLLHELGHAVVAQRRGVRIDGIDLHLLGGVAKMVDPPRSPTDELWIALAGPLVSLALAVASAAAWTLTQQQVPAEVTSVLAFSTRLNGMLGVFNLVPALPMDGGRVLRAMLARRSGLTMGTRRALVFSKLFSVLFVVVGFFVDKTLWLMALFVWWMGREEGTQIGWHERQQNLGHRDEELDPWVPYERAAARERGETVAPPPVVDVLRRRQGATSTSTDAHQRLVRDGEGRWRVLHVPESTAD